MASRMSEECTPLKREYDACFNAWLEGYLEPVARPENDKARAARQAAKAAEYDAKCGAIWTAYRSCVRVRRVVVAIRCVAHAGVQKAVDDKGLSPLLETARKDDPLATPPPPPSRSS